LSIYEQHDHEDCSPLLLIHSPIDEYVEQASDRRLVCLGSECRRSVGPSRGVRIVEKIGEMAEGVHVGAS
jgi:hypothetical protein